MVVVTDGDTVAFAHRVVGSITPHGVVSTAQGTASVGTAAPSTPAATTAMAGATTTANSAKAATPSTAAPFWVSSASGAKFAMPPGVRLSLGALVPVFCSLCLLTGIY